jgi:hypothetical protein
MAMEYSVETCRRLAGVFSGAELHRPMRIERYDAGDELTYDVTGIAPAVKATVRLAIDKFVGGGFAGQVYLVRIIGIDAPDGPVVGLQAGRDYALKILIPPSRVSRKVRDTLYAAGFQAPFQQQVNPAAARAGALWQKFIRRAAALAFGTELCVADIHATLTDYNLGGCGELREWVDGRVWRFEADDRLDVRRRWGRGRDVPAELLGSPEYRAKREFMRKFVVLLHKMGAPELARQYEWWTCKSQPNVLKRLEDDGSAAAGLTAVDFRAGLALLPFLPMSPGDVRLILAGLLRGRIVQFDRGNIEKLERFVNAHSGHFADMAEAMEELKADEQVYRNSQPDITHNHVRLLASPRLWRTMLDSAVTGWRISGAADEKCARRLRAGRLLTLLFCAVGLLGFLSLAAAVAILAVGLAAGCSWLAVVGAAVGVAAVGRLAGRAIRRLWGRGDYRRHYFSILTSATYLRRAVRGHIAETLIRWHRRGRINAAEAKALVARPGRLALHLPLSILPSWLHRLLVDPVFAAAKLKRIFVWPVQLYFNPAVRERWMLDMVAEGRRNGMLTDEDAATIESRIKEPFIQKYLKCLAVHVCTLPVSELVWVTLALLYVFVWAPPGMPRAEAWGIGLGIVGLFQVIPISPGSLIRGLYVLYLMIRERNFRDYNVAVVLGFFKYIGYLAFPIQMAYRYPALARFMAAHWATGAARIVPVFGERGALLEHGVFDLFYNRPLTIRRQMRTRAELRAGLAPRYWHALPIVLLAVGLWALVDVLWLRGHGAPPTLGNVWYLAFWPTFLAGLAVAAWARGASVMARVKLAMLCGAAVGLIYGAFHVFMHVNAGIDLATLSKRGGREWNTAALVLWRVFIFAGSAALGALAGETLAGEKD